MWFKRKKTDQQEYFDSLYEDRYILDEMITEHKKNRKTLLDLLRDIVRHTKPVTDYSYDINNVKFDGLHIYWYLVCGERHIHALYKNHDIPDDMAEDLYKLYRMVWCGVVEVR